MKKKCNNKCFNWQFKPFNCNEECYDYNKLLEGKDANSRKHNGDI